MAKYSLWVISLALSLVLFTISASSSLTAEKPYPNRPINMIVGFAPGGASDLGSKVISDRLGEFLREPVVSVYKPGGGGTLAASYVARAKPDGYTTLVMASFMNLPPEVKKLDYKLEDFILTGIWGRAPFFVIVKADSKWKNLKEFIVDAKKSPGKLTCGVPGIDSGGYFLYRLLAKHAEIKLAVVPFKSAGESFSALLGGHIDSYFAVGAGGVAESPLVRTLAIAEEKRLEGYPDIPTISEFGWPVKFSAWFSFAFPKGTPKEVIDKFCSAQKKAIEKYSKEIGEGMRKIDMVPILFDPQETVKKFKAQYDAIRTVKKEAGPAAEK